MIDEASSPSATPLPASCSAVGLRLKKAWLAAAIGRRSPLRLTDITICGFQDAAGKNRVFFRALPLVDFGYWSRFAVGQERFAVSALRISTLRVLALTSNTH